jgi:hypothetical protein
VWDEQETCPDPVREIQLCYLTHVAGDDPAPVYRQTIELAVAAQELGFASF